MVHLMSNNILVKLEQGYNLIRLKNLKDHLAITLEGMLEPVTRKVGILMHLIGTSLIGATRLLFGNT